MNYFIIKLITFNVKQIVVMINFKLLQHKKLLFFILLI